MTTLQVNKQKSKFMYKIFNHISYFDFIYKQPMLLARLIRNYFEILVFKKKLLRITDIAVTYACNATCEHCCTDTNVDNRKKPLSTEELQSCIRQAVGLGSMIFNFLGGEPLLCKHIYDTIRFVKSKNAIAGMSTNGYLLSKEVVGKLKDAGLDVIQVDLGGGIDPHEIDEIRKLSGCYERAITGISLLKQAGIKVVLSTILTKKNVANGDIWKMIQLAEDLEVKINVNCSAQVGSWANNKDSRLTEKEFKVYEKIMKLPFTRWAGSTNYLGEYCPCGTEKIYITAYGDVIPCGLQSFKFGNIKEEPLKAILSRMNKNSVCNGRKKKACRAAWDKEIIDLNQKLYADTRLKPLTISEITEKEVVNK